MDKQTLQINGLTSLQQDLEYKQYDTIQSMSTAEYILKNNRKNKEYADIATNHLMVNFSDGFGLNKDNLDDEKRTGKVNNFKGDANQLFPRPYMTIPYTGKGNHEVNEESDLKHSHITSHSKTSNNMKGFNVDYQYTPLMAHIKDKVQDPDHIIQENIKEDWIRGGVDTTQIRKDFDYMDRCLDNETVRKILLDKKTYLTSEKQSMERFNKVNPVENTTILPNSESLEKVNYTNNYKLEGVGLESLTELNITNSIENVKPLSKNLVIPNIYEEK